MYMSAILVSEFLKPVLRSCVVSSGSLTWMSTAPYLMSNRNKPRSSGDKGPGKNYQKKIAKKANKNNLVKGLKDSGNTSNETKPLHTQMKGLKNLNDSEHSLKDNGNMSRESDPLHSLMKRLRNLEDSEHDSVQEKMQDDVSESLFDMLRGRNKGTGFMRQQQEKLEERVDYDHIPRASPQMKRPINFINPDSGSRLGIFSHIDATIKLVPPGNPNLTEEDKQNELEEIRLLQTTSYFQDLIDGRGVPYPRQFPVDNENYVHGESEVSYKDHVLLDNLIMDFPARGPVRHFMELVVTGLSMNPDYTVTEKTDIVRWYKDYFDQFSPAELQALPAKNLPTLDAVMTN